MDIYIRNATTADCDQISTMVSGLAAEHIIPSLTENGKDILLASMAPQPTRKRIEDGWLHLCGLLDSELIGVAVVKPQCHLYHLFVVTAFQRKGVGGKLFSAADASTFAETQSYIATVNSSLNAVSAYEHFGFANDGPIVDTDGVRCQPMVRENGG